MAEQTAPRPGRLPRHGRRLAPSCWTRRPPPSRTCRLARPARARRCVAAGALRGGRRRARGARARLAADGLSADAEIVETGALMARDPRSRRPSSARCSEDGRPAVAAILAATDAQAALLAALPDELLAARADDVRSVGRRAARLAHGAPTSTSGAAGGIARRGGSRPRRRRRRPGLGAGHRAGRPAARPPTPRSSPDRSGSRWSPDSGRTCWRVAQGAALVLDGDAGARARRPAGERQAAARRDRGPGRRAPRRDRGALPAGRHAPTGTRLTVLANVASAAEVRAALDAGAEGVGLLRTELLLPGRGALAERGRAPPRAAPGPGAAGRPRGDRARAGLRRRQAAAVPRRPTTTAAAGSPCCCAIRRRSRISSRRSSPKAPRAGCASCCRWSTTSSQLDAVEELLARARARSGVDRPARWAP